MKTLRETKIGETVKVVKLHGEGPVKRRIMDMGITKGVEIYVRKVAPLGDPMDPDGEVHFATLQRFRQQSSYLHLLLPVDGGDAG